MKLSFGWRAVLALTQLLVVLWPLLLHKPATLAASPSAATPEVQWKSTSTGPRELEADTQQSIQRDYARAWENLSEASEFNLPQLLDAYFEGSANTQFKASVRQQQATGTRLRYTAQHHRLEPVFYAPAGDVIELRDSAEYQCQFLDGDKLLLEQPVKADFYVLMVPGADRWIVRQLQQQPAR
jgi:hypothetical protein